MSHFTSSPARKFGFGNDSCEVSAPSRSEHGYELPELLELSTLEAGHSHAASSAPARTARTQTARSLQAQARRRLRNGWLDHSNVGRCRGRWLPTRVNWTGSAAASIHELHSGR